MTPSSDLRWTRTLRILAIAVGIALTSLACRTVGGDPIAPTIRSAAFCVEAHEADKRNFEIEITQSLKLAGLDATSAKAGECPEEIPYRINYVDHFGWDMRSYLARLVLEVVDTQTGEILAWGSSQQDSLGALGTSYRDVIDRAVAALIAQNDGGTPL